MLCACRHPPSPAPPASRIPTDRRSFLATASSLLTSLGNPHNLSLLTSHLLTAPAFWDRPDGLRTPLRLLSVFHAAVTAVAAHHDAVRRGNAPALVPGQAPVGGGLTLDGWVRAVVAGADDRSQRWKHLVVLGGLLVGMAGLEAQGVGLHWAAATRKRVEAALATATNLALVEIRERAEQDGLGGQTITLVLNHCFGHLAGAEKAQVDYDLLLPVVIGTAYYSNEGFQSAYFLGGLDLDVQLMPSAKLNWSVRQAPCRRRCVCARFPCSY